MSKESNNKPNTGTRMSMPGGMRGLVDKVFENKPADEPKEIVQKTQEVESGTIDKNPKNSSELVDFRNFLEGYNAGDPYDRNTVYLTSEIKDVLDKLKASKELKKYSLKDILNSIIHAYILEHRDDVVSILNSRNNILD